jgi:hypothetical protein
VDTLENILLRVQAIATMTRLAAQQTTDELRPETVYETMLAIEDYLDEALHRLLPLKREAEASIDRVLQGLRRAER